MWKKICRLSQEEWEMRQMFLLTQARFNGNHFPQNSFSFSEFGIKALTFSKLIVINARSSLMSFTLLYFTLRIQLMDKNIRDSLLLNLRENRMSPVLSGMIVTADSMLPQANQRKVVSNELKERVAAE